MLEQYIKGEIVFNIENIMNYENDNDVKESIEQLTEKDIDIICNKLLNSEWFMTELNEFINSNIEDEIYHYVNNIKEVA